MRRMSIVLVLLLAAPVVAQLSDQPRTISVSGEAVVMVSPDQVVVTIGVETFDPSLDVASTKNEQVARNLIAEWRKVGVADPSIRTSGVVVEIVYDDRSGSRRRAVEGYVVRRTYDVTVPSARGAEDVINRGLQHGANLVSGIDLRSTQMRKHRDEARVAAAKAAREKAELIAAQLGAKVGAPRSVTETTGHYGWGARGQSAMTQNTTSYAPAGETDGDASGAVAPGQMAIRASVSVVFDLDVAR